MSENSASLHFWRTGREQVRELVLSQKAGGRVVAANDHWLCFVPFDATDEQNVILHAQGNLMKWSYYDDYALGLEFFGAGTMMGEASFVWGTELTGQPPSGSLPPELVSKLRGLGLAVASLDELVQIAEDVASGHAGGTEVRDRAARALGLAAYDWLSPETCLDLPIEEFKRMYPEAEEIDYPD